MRHSGRWDQQKMFQKEQHLPPPPSHRRLVCSDGNLRSNFLEGSGCKLLFRQKWHANPHDKRYTPFVPSHPKDFGKAKVRQEPGLNGFQGKHLSTRQALLGDSGRAEPSCQAHAGTFWPGGKAVLKMKSSLWLPWLLAFVPICIWLQIWHSVCFLKKKKTKGDSPFQTQAWRENNSLKLPPLPLPKKGIMGGGGRGVSKPSVSNPQLRSFLTEALGSGWMVFVLCTWRQQRAIYGSMLCTLSTRKLLVPGCWAGGWGGAWGPCCNKSCVNGTQMVCTADRLYALWGCLTQKPVYSSCLHKPSKAHTRP